MGVIGRLKRWVPRTWKGRLRVVVYGLPVVVLAGDMALVQWWRRIPVSVETTRIVAPLKADGMLDYVAWMDGKLREGVTAENNAAVVLFSLVPEDSMPKEYRKNMARELGVPENAMAGAEKIRRHSLYERIRRAGDSDEALFAAINRMNSVIDGRPWKSEEYPPAAEWLRENERYLEQFRIGLQRPRFYAPPLDLEGKRAESLREVWPLDLQWFDVHRCLMSRALLRTGEGNYRGALDDVSEAYKVTALGPTMGSDRSFAGRRWVDRRVAMVARGMPSLGLRELLKIVQAAGPLNEERAEDEWLRFEQLENLQYALKYGLGPALERTARKDEVPYLTTGIVGRLLRAVVPINYPTMSRTVNGWYDRWEDAKRLRGYAAQRAAEKALIDSTSEVRRNAKPWRGELLLVALWRSEDAESRASSAVHHDMALLAVGLEGFRSEHGAYPERLAELIPGWLSELPTDSFSAKAFAYRKNEGGYVLYSAGKNMIDDGGKRDKERGDVVLQVKDGIASWMD